MAGREIEFILIEPVGQATVRVIVTEAPLDVPIAPGSVYAFGADDFAQQILSALVDVVGVDDGAMRLSNWGTAGITYEIHR